MRRLLYLIRKVFGTIVLGIAIALICIMVSDQRGAIQHASTFEALMYVLLGLFILGGFVFLWKDKYCSCGYKYSSNSYESLNEFDVK